ncbi:ATP-binding protein [Haladaptatus sp. DFWS20]|uniref:ATP-binding protein n=1 Tax=Haladaptatus sp. DFWS20 TaxID=3403467 RepID=UPI003EBC8AC0
MSKGDETYDLAPSKQTYRSLKSDVNPISSVKELVDNVLDNWRRAGKSGDFDLTIDIDIDFDAGTFRIEDDSGGISDGDISKIFALGESTNSDVSWSIGAYGMGAKKAIVRLGRKATIKSRMRDEEQGYGFVVDEEWLNSDSWSVDRQIFDNLREGTTIIEIEDLQIQVESEMDETGEETDGDEEAEAEEVSASFKSPKDFAQQLREDLSESYQEFLYGRATPSDGNLTIVVNGEEVKNPSPPDWSYTPYDGFHPRLFKQYQISPSNLPSNIDRATPISIDVEVGLLREGKEEEAGTDVIIQNRKIISASKEEEGGWGNFLPAFNPQRRRTKFVLKLSTEKEPDDLPWDTQKSHLDISNPIAEKAYNFLKRAGEEYAKAEYGDFPTAFTKPYKSDHDEAWGDSLDEEDYSSRKRVMHSPDGSKPQTTELRDLVEYHKEIGVFAPCSVPKSHRAAYRPEFHDQQSPDIDYTPEEGGEYVIIGDEIEDLSEQVFHGWLSTLSDLAKNHVEIGERVDFNGEEPWWKEYYNREIIEAEGNLSELTATILIESIEDTVSEKLGRGNLPDPILDKILNVKDEKVEESGDEEDTDEHETNDIDDTVGEDSVGKSKRENEESDERDRERKSSDVEDEEGEEKDDGSDFDLGDGLGGTENISSRDDTKSTSILLELTPEVHQELCDEVGQDPENVTPGQLGRKVMKAGIDIRDYLERDEMRSNV